MSICGAAIRLAARRLAKETLVLNHKGRRFTDQGIGSALAMRDLMNELREDGMLTDGPAPMPPNDRSRFLSKLDEAVHAVRRTHQPQG